MLHCRRYHVRTVFAWNLRGACCRMYCFYKALRWQEKKSTHLGSFWGHISISGKKERLRAHYLQQKQQTQWRKSSTSLDTELRFTQHCGGCFPSPEWCEFQWSTRDRPQARRSNESACVHTSSHACGSRNWRAQRLSDDDLTKVMDSAILRGAKSKLDVDLRCDLHVKATDVSGFLNGKITGALQEFVNMPSRDAIGRAPLGKPGNILKKVRGLQDSPAAHREFARIIKL